MNQIVHFRWPRGLTYRATIKQRWFPWFTDNLTLGATIYMRHARDTLSKPIRYGPTIRHEGTHVRQYADRGWWWVWTHPRKREDEARLAQSAGWPVMEPVELIR